MQAEIGHPSTRAMYVSKEVAVTDCLETEREAYRSRRLGLQSMVLSVLLPGFNLQ